MERKPVTEALRSAGFRATEGRIRLFAALAGSRRPVSARELTRALRRTLDEANVYRALKAFERRGLVRTVQIEHGLVRFELAREHHHHLVCRSCGSIEDVHIPADRVLNRQALACSTFGSVLSHRLEFFGLCAPCAGKC